MNALLAPPPTDDALERVVRALRTVRALLVRSEFDIHSEVRKALKRAKLRAMHEYPLSTGARVDFLVQGGIAIEIKKGKPNSTDLEQQAAKYAKSPLVRAVVLVVERNVINHPTTLDGKPVRLVSLTANWGIA